VKGLLRNLIDNNGLHASIFCGRTRASHVTSLIAQLEITFPLAIGSEDIETTY
jgi:hypothetical protein